MSDHWSEDERAAAFLEGRMDPRRREEMMARLLADAEEREIVAATASILRQMEEADAAASPPDGVIPIDAAKGAREAGAEPDRARRGKVAPVVRWLALAAGIAAIALLAAQLLRERPSPYDPVRLAARLPGEQAASPELPWISRGPAETLPAEKRGRDAYAVRAGARLLDLSIAVESGDSLRTRDLARRLADRLEPEAERRSPLRRLETEAGSSPRKLRPLVAQATKRLGEKVDPEALQLGAWLQAARVATAHRDAAFFQEAEVREMLDRASRITRNDLDGPGAVARVRGLLPRAGQPPPWKELDPALGTLLDVAGRS